MQRLVLITYLTLVLAVAGQVVHAQKYAADNTDKQQVREVAVEITRDHVRSAEALATRSSENPQAMRAHHDERKEAKFWGD